jgi:AraC family transcriptional regulator of adaptative response / DNA-3-methyladenine glycosylase II
VRLEFTPPLFPDNLFGHLVATAVPGVEEWRDGWYRRTVRGVGIVELAPREDRIELRVNGDADAAVPVCRFLLDLDADPATVDAHLDAVPFFAPLVRNAPGRRVPRTVDPAEMALRAVLGQQVSTAAAATHAARLVRAAGEPVADDTLTHFFPTPAAVAAVDDSVLALPRSRRATLRALADALAGGLDLDDTGALLALRGIGPWTVGTIRMRALGDRDAYPAGDLGLRGLEAELDRCRPYRAYAVQHLWALGNHAINKMPQ